MKDHLEAWRVRPWIWGAPLALVIVGVLLVVFFQTAFAGRVAQLETRYERQGRYLENLRQERLDVEAFMESTDAQGEAVKVLYHEYFGREKDRFVPILVEVREMARRSGLDPKSFAYPEDQLEGTDLVRRRINFSVEGRYEDLRKFVNLLESTQEFITLERVSLNGGDPRQARLGIQLSLSTIFARQLDSVDEPETVPDDATPEGEAS